MVTEQNKDDFLEVIYRMGADKINGVVLLAVVKIQFDHWEDDVFWNTAKALEDEKLIVLRSPTGHVALTLDGRHRIENRLNPNPSVTQNTINVDRITNSPIQQGGAHATMTQTVNYYSPQDLDNLRRLMEVFDEHIDELQLDAAAKRKAMAQVATIKAQLEDEPDPVIVKQAGRTLRNITEGAIGSLIASGVWAWAAPIMLQFFGS